MKITFTEKQEDTFYIGPRRLMFRPMETKNESSEICRLLLEKNPYRGLELDKSQISHIQKTPTDVIIVMKDGTIIKQRKPEEIKYEKIVQKMDRNKLQIAFFMKNITSHYSGGRYWAWLLAHIIGEDQNTQVTIITNTMPPFGDSFREYENVFIYLADKNTDVTNMGRYIPYNVFDYVIGVPIEGGVSAELYAKKWKIPYACMIYETPNFVRDYREGSDSKDTSFQPYRQPMFDCNVLINNTEIGKEYADKWLGFVTDNNGNTIETGFDKSKSKWLWNSTNTKVIDSVEQEANSDPKTKHVIYIGRAVTFKRQMHIVKALNQIKKYNWIIHVISGGANSLVQEMKNQAQGHVSIEYHSKVDDYEKFRILKKCDLMFWLTNFEGFGIPAMEAMLCEKICISYELPILKHIYENHIVYCDRNNIDDVVKATRKWIKDSPEKTKFIQEAKDHALKIADHDRVQKDFFELIGREKIQEKKTISILHGKNRYTFGMIVCNGEQFIYDNLKHIYDVADQIIIVEGAVNELRPLIGSCTSTDRTLQVARDFINDYDRKNKKIKLFTSSDQDDCWNSKMEMQNLIAENTDCEYYIKQDVDEFYNLSGLMGEILKLSEQPNKIMINYPSYHFWGDINHVIKGANFNDKQTRVWKWNKNYRHQKTFNVFVDIKTGNPVGPNSANTITAEDHIFHYSYLYTNYIRKTILKYYEKRDLGSHSDVYDAFMYQDPSRLKDGRYVVEVDLKHPISDELLKKYMRGR